MLIFFRTKEEAAQKLIRKASIEKLNALFIERFFLFNQVGDKQSKPAKDAN